MNEVHLGAIAGAAKPMSQSPSPLNSTYTARFPEILDQRQISLAVTTYQANKLILLRNDRGALNSHFRTFDLPMGVASSAGRFSLGCRTEIREFQNLPAAAQKFTPPSDVCFLPRSIHVTGDIEVHELAHGANEQLWFVNTRFSCLATLDGRSSFVPQWLPPFISKLAPEDRCHLNGLALVDGKPTFVTALGATDSADGWRGNKAAGGVLVDVPGRNIVASGLSMPHSPRWHNGKLWLLESGKGTLATVDLVAGRVETVCTLPGFTRGLSFSGEYAFVGLSQVRETAHFSGIPITERPQERFCGVAVVDTNSGRLVASVKFTEAVQEIFAVEVLAGMRFPELIVEDRELIANSFVIGPPPRPR